MNGIIKLAIGLGLTYCILAWATGNPNSASSLVDKAGSLYDSGAEFVSENLFDKTGEK